ncbi:kinesin-domain-containing protein [Mollisia scopiformis]|uniref:Kinesin-like protein n=1 Tax=Mollisia scopiformis TaxID=149040 RepID=A0A194XQQ2_MOLSC|nr:kinesin-domain-containing protein [Mollisia scopiformis]KUJ22496.1 kinesin-domain-containing protein [Mollisia scopiformis]
MAAALPRPSRPSYGPPNTALPALPTTKTRKSTGNIPSGSEAGTALHPLPNLPKSGLRAPSASHLALPTTPGGSSTLPKSKATPGVNSAGKTIRKTISINAFPQPPRGIRTTSLPPSPLSGGAAPGSSLPSRRESTDTSPAGSSKPRKRKTGSSPKTQSYAAGVTPSLLNGSGDSRSISSGPGARGSDGLLSLPSPPQSRSSSAQDSYSTSATTFDDTGDGPRGRDASDSTNDNSKLTEGKGNVIVSVRVRPDAAEGKKTENGEWMVDGRRSLVAYRGKEGGDYYYDNVFATHDNNAKVYDASAKRLVRRVMEGYHGTVFAYGMTGTGKTFSMQGTATSPGVIPLAITDIFSYIRETPSREFLLRVSYLEIYNEKIHDLLSAPPAGTGPGVPQQEEIKLREDSKRGVYASPLKEEIVQSPTQLLRVIARGDHARRTSSTQFNARSSRSHAVVQIVVESRERIPGSGAMSENKRSGLLPGGVRVSTLSLIDLAGSERAAETKERRTEGSHINKSLLTLGTVIARLSGDKDKDGKPTDKDGKHLPYRDSKLTRLLQGALSGDSLVSILCTIQIGSAGSTAAANTHTGETINTLKFASRAKNNIVSHAKKAEEALGAGGDGGARVLLERYRMEILELRSQLDGQAKAKSEDDEREREKEAEQRHEEQMLEMQLARTALKERIEHLNRLILSSKSTGVNASGSYSSLGMHPRLSAMTSNGHLSQMSARSSLAQSTTGRNSLERTSSMKSVSTIGQLPKSQRLSGERLSNGSVDEEDSLGEFGDGTASLAAQNRALQADLADKTRYCQTLEKRLLQARRSSHSRTSVGFSNSKNGIMVGEDHGVAALLKEKDAEIADLRARLDDKDRMLTALRSAARSRDTADRDPRTSQIQLLDNGPLTPASARASQLLDNGPLSPILSAGPVGLLSPKIRKRTKSVDEMSKMLDEMIQDRVESGQLVKGVRGSVRIASERKRDTLAEALTTLEPLKNPLASEAPAMVAEV